MPPESPAPAPSSPPSPDPNFPPLSVSHSHKIGRRSVSRIPVARVSPGIPVSQMLVPSFTSLDGHSIPPRPSPPPSSPSAIASPLLPSFLSSHIHPILDIDAPAPIPSFPCSPCSAASASVSGVRPSWLCSPPALDVSRATAEVPRLAVSDQFDDLGELDVANSGLSVGTRICAIPSNRSSPEQDGSPTTKDAFNILQMGSPDSMDPDVPVGNPSGFSRSQVVHQMT